MFSQIQPLPNAQFLQVTPQPTIYPLQTTQALLLVIKSPALHSTSHLTSNQVQDQNKKLREIVTVSNDGAWREEIEIEMRNEDGESYTGTVTMTEAKHSIYRDGLGYTDFKNFDGVR